MIDHSIKIESVITKPGENSGGAKNFWVQTYKSKPNKKIDEIMTMRISRQEITFLRHLDAKIQAINLGLILTSYGTEWEQVTFWDQTEWDT